MENDLRYKSIAIFSLASLFFIFPPKIMGKKVIGCS